MNPELKALLLGCKEAPEEDEPRQILADWLEEQGEADRAEFVRLQLRLPQDEWLIGPRQFAGPDPDESEVVGRAWELWRRHRAEWLGPLAESGLDVRCRRGLLIVRVGQGQVHRLTGVAGRNPWLETLCLDPAEPADLREVLANGWLAPFSRLELLRGHNTDGLAGALATAGDAVAHLRALVTAHGDMGSWVRLLDSPHLAGLRLGHVEMYNASAPVAPTAGPVALRSLALSFGELDGERTADLFSGARYPALTRLALGGGRSDAGDLRSLARAPLLARLEWLSLANSGLDRHGIEALAALPAPLRLRGLSVNNCHLLRPQSMARLLAAPLLGSVTHLNASDVPCGRRAAQAVSRSPWLERLEVLCLGHSEAGDAGASSLARAVGLRALRRLAVRAWNIGPAGATALAAAPWAGGLETLDLSFNPLTSAGLEALAPLARSGVRRLGLGSTRTRPSWAPFRPALPARLVALDLNANHLGPAGLEALLPALEPLEELAELRLDDNTLGDEGARLLAASPVIRRLRRLDLGNNALTVVGLRPLLDALGPGRLTELRLYNNHLGQAGLRLLEDWPARERLATLLVQGNKAWEAESGLYRFWGNEL
jgi:uncharacterized protein (TIGR02996 family)